MPNVFKYTDYREFLTAMVRFRAERGETQAVLAKAMGCQAAYFSQVLKGRADLTEDHAIGLCLHLEMDEHATDYYLLLLRKARAGTARLQHYLEGRGARLVKEIERVENHVPSSKIKVSDALGIYYCASWIPSAIHIATSCMDLRTVKALKARFGLPEDVIESHLLELEKFGLVKLDEGKWLYAGGSFHFPKSSPLDQQLQLSRRQLASQTIALRRKEDINYSVIFATDARTVEWIRERFLELIESIHEKVEPTAAKDVFAISLDLFKA